MVSDTLSSGLQQYRIGPKLRALRLRKKLGLVELGRHTGLSPAMLSKIERGLVFPTLPTLLRIALVFGVGLEHFFTEPAGRPRVAVVRKRDRLLLPRSTGRGPAGLSLREPRLPRHRAQDRSLLCGVPARRACVRAAPARRRRADLRPARHARRDRRRGGDRSRPWRRHVLRLRRPPQLPPPRPLELRSHRGRRAMTRRRKGPRLDVTPPPPAGHRARAAARRRRASAAALPAPRAGSARCGSSRSWRCPPAFPRRRSRRRRRRLRGRGR